MKLKIGELSKMSGVAVSTLGRYESAGLLEPSYRTSGRFRLYDDYLLDRIRFIRFCRAQGLDFSEIKKILDFMDNPEKAGPALEGALDKLIKKTESEIYSLGRHLKELKALRKAEKCLSRTDCGRLGTDGLTACSKCGE